MAEIARLRKIHDAMIAANPREEYVRMLPLRIRGLALGFTEAEIQQRQHWRNYGFSEEYLNEFGCSYAGL